MDLETFLISLYVLVDDLLKARQQPSPPRVGRPARLSDAEVLTLAILAQWPRWRSERDFLRFANSHLRTYFPDLLSQSQLNRRIRDLERLATKLGCRAPWKNERLFRRPKKEDRRGHRKGDAQDRGRPYLRRGHLLGQALRGDLPQGEIPRSKETPRLEETETGRRGEEAFGGQPRGAS